jgi:hypothetical protein
MAHGRDKERSRRNRQRIREYLMAEWDPIGVEGIPEAQDEYDTYVARLYVMLMDENASPTEMAEYLHHIESDHMGLGNQAGREEVCRQIGENLFDMRALFAAANLP